MSYVPKWFSRELKMIDPSYYVQFNDHYGYFEIKKRVHYYVMDGWGRSEERLEAPSLATFKLLNDAALTNLRKRKLVGLKFKGSTKAYLKYLRSLNQESKRKGKALAREMMAEGFMRIHNIGRRKIFT